MNQDTDSIRIKKNDMNFFEKDKRSGFDSIVYAQHIAFAPVVFQASRCLRDFGILTAADMEDGLTQDEIMEKTKLPLYGVRVLLEAGLGIGLLTCNNGKYKTTTTGRHIVSDKMTVANMDFIHDVCYKGMFDLKDSILNGKNEGLKALGNWKTVYEGLTHLPQQVRESWLKFDHYYSDDSYPLVIPLVLKYEPKNILDIGGNTGKFTLQCLKSNNEIKIGIVDLPGQLNMASENITRQGLADRVKFHEVDLLDERHPLPKNYDAIWMSQFLDCFSENEIISILKRCVEAMDKNAHVFILEPFWNKQKYEVSAFCLQMTSLYFTNIANGNSQMYDSALFLELIDKSGLKVVEQIDNVGVSHSLIVCVKK
ncbi:MAG TPA: class I SAM-dependent methyltransferase [Bacteroidia bacterium]|nr:class I SAM-dependent methyltransferase [Bacteroidia bacterium]